MADNRGVTLVELVVALAIAVILVAALNASLQGWRGRYSVESQIRQIYGDVMAARVNAMQENRVYFVIFPDAKHFALYEDDDPAPDGNGTLETASDTLLGGSSKSLAYEMAWQGGTIPYDGSASGRLELNSRGLIATVGNTIRVDMTLHPDIHADYDCILLSETAINLGKWDGGACVVK